MSVTVITPEAIEAKHAAERAIDGYRRAISDGDPEQAMNLLATTCASLLDRVARPRARALADAMVGALGELGRSTRNDAGALMAASRKLEAALRAVISDATPASGSAA